VCLLRTSLYNGRANLPRPAISRRFAVSDEIDTLRKRNLRQRMSGTGNAHPDRPPHEYARSTIGTLTA
jgi:hypothetical protein